MMENMLEYGSYKHAHFYECKGQAYVYNVLIHFVCVRRLVMGMGNPGVILR